MVEFGGHAAILEGSLYTSEKKLLMCIVFKLSDRDCRKLWIQPLQFVVHKLHFVSFHAIQHFLMFN